MEKTQPWADAPVIKNSSNPWEFFGAKEGELDNITPFNATDGSILTTDKKAIDEAVARGGKLVYYQRPAGNFFAAVLRRQQS